MNALSNDLLLAVCEALDDDRHTLLDLAHAGRRRLTDAAACQLYREVDVDDKKAAQLARTLDVAPQYRPLVRSLTYRVGTSLCEPLDDEEAEAPCDMDVFATVGQLVRHLPVLRELVFDCTATPILAYTPLLDPLLGLHGLVRATVLAPENAMPLNRLAPLLEVWAPTLIHLNLGGATTWKLLCPLLELPSLPVLRELRLAGPRISDEALLLLGGDAGLHSLELDLNGNDDAREDGEDSQGPTDQGILALLDKHGPTLRKLIIRRGWLGHVGGDYRLGLAGLERCPSLEWFELYGQIFSSDMLKRGAKAVRVLRLEWCSVISYEDLTEAVRSDKWPALKEMWAKHMGYEEDFPQATVDALVAAGKRRSLKIDAGALYGPFNAADPASPPPLPTPALLSPATPRSARWPPSSPRSYASWPMTPVSPAGRSLQGVMATMQLTPLTAAVAS